MKHRKIFLLMLLFSMVSALLLAGCTMEKDSQAFTAPLSEIHQEELLAAIRRWGEENVPQHAQAELQFSENTGDGENNTIFAPHLYDLQTGQIRTVDGMYSGEACLGVIYYMAPKTDDRPAEYHLFYLVQGQPETADPVEVMKKELSQYGSARVLNAGWRQQNGNCLFINTWFVAEGDQLMRYVYNGVTGYTLVKAVDDDRGNGWAMTLSQLPDAMAAVTAVHDQVESDYLMSWSGNVIERVLSKDATEQARLLSNWSTRQVLDLATKTIIPLEGYYAPAANYGAMSFLYPSQHAEYVYLVTNSAP